MDDGVYPLISFISDHRQARRRMNEWMADGWWGYRRRMTTDWPILTGADHSLSHLHSITSHQPDASVYDTGLLTELRDSSMMAACNAHASCVVQHTSGAASTGSRSLLHTTQACAQLDFPISCYQPFLKICIHHTINGTEKNRTVYMIRKTHIASTKFQYSIFSHSNSNNRLMAYYISSVGALLTIELSRRIWAAAASQRLKVSVIRVFHEYGNNNNSVEREANNSGHYGRCVAIKPTVCW